MQDINVTASNIQQGKVVVSNDYFFKNLSDVELQWSIAKNGKAIQAGTIRNLSIDPQQRKGLIIPFTHSLVKPGAEYDLNFVFKLKAANKWAMKGHPVAIAQLKFPAISAALQIVKLDTIPALELKQGENITVAGKDFAVVFDRSKGVLSKLSFKGKDLISDPVVPNFWRVPTDNDEGGKNRGFAQRWRNAGLDSISIEPLEMKAESVAPAVVRVLLNNRIRLKKTSINHTAVYTIYGSGDIEVDNSFETKDELPPLARVGVQFQLPANFDHITWFGNGPFESYDDRKESALSGLYSGLVSGQRTHTFYRLCEVDGFASIHLKPVKNNPAH